MQGETREIAKLSVKQNIDSRIVQTSNHLTQPEMTRVKEVNLESTSRSQQDTTAEWIRQHNNYFEASGQKYDNNQSNHTIHKRESQ